MANSALIDDLLKQFADNPRRVFARLANEYRKRGELDSAIEICRSHVPLQPGYISGHIVLGQALYDSGSLDEARTTFETALALDPENLIALRHMGDIAQADGDVPRARAWYRQLLEIDPQNEDVASQLEALGADTDAAPALANAPDDEAAGWGELNPEAIELDYEEVPVEAAAPPEEAVDAIAPPEAALAPAEETLEGSTSSAAESVRPEVEAHSVDSTPADIPAIAAVEGLETTAFQGEDSAAISALELVDLDELSSAGDALLPADAEVAASAAGAFAEEADGAAKVSENEPSRAPVGPLFAADQFGDTPDGAPDDDAAPGAFATETMAELYLQQGFPDRALAIYRELASRNPGDASLRERLAELEDGGPTAPEPEVTAKSARTAREFFGVLAYRRAPRTVVAEAAAISAGEPRVSSNGHVEGHNGKPGKEAASALSLDDVFRDSPAAAESRPRGGLSFDEFFARRDSGLLPERSDTAVTTEAEENGVGEERTSEGDASHDLELFHAWLDGLKG